VQTTVRIVVVGAGLAGVRAAESLREQGFSGDVVVLGDEDHLPYNRPPLSKQLLAGTWETDKVALRSQDEWAALDVDLRLGVGATGLDLEQRSLRLSDGSTVDFDGLIIATGAHARMLPNLDGRPGVHTLRSLSDALDLRDALTAAESVVVIGGGFIGAEVASTARGLDKSVTLVEPQETLVVRGLGPELGATIEYLHRDNGVDVRVGTSIESITDDGMRTALSLSDGTTVVADVVVVGVGAAPSTEWLADSGLDVSNGVACDEFCRVLTQDGSPVSAITASGDVARWRSNSEGSDIRMEHWTHAQEQARAAAATVLADLGESSDVPQAFDPVPYVWSDQFGKKIQVVGYVRSSDVAHVAIGSMDSGSYLALMERDGHYVGAVAMAKVPALVQARMLLEQGVDLPSALAAFEDK
jgi:NADPH-dependent 2,4-dienoyl-CoA reductase/sulfur reductase-like enzyme